MTGDTLHLLAADGLLLLHTLFVGFIVTGLVLVLAGGALGWNWVRNPWFRLAHGLGIAFVVVQAWLGQVCPLTTWEMALRAKAGAATYPGAFIAHWLETLLYYRAPAWVFILAYTVFGALVLLAWWLVPPRGKH
jgi:hypothetical protein